MFGSGKPDSAEYDDTYTRSCRLRPTGLLRYEHMFPSTRASTFAQRALGALRLTRSFLLLEDDYDVDWEVDPNEHLQAPHPHRVPLRGRGRTRRPGEPAGRNHVCLSPVGRPVGGHNAPRGERTRRAGTAAH
jgi:hypothetical protein